MKCEACGLQGANVQLTHVRTTNGGLYLCRQCLGDINRKCPAVKTLEDICNRTDLYLEYSKQIAREELKRIKES